MSSDGRDDDIELLGSSYDGDISDTDSEASTVIAAKITASAQPIQTDNERHESQREDSGTGTICIGCNVQDAGPGVESDEEAQFGAIWIGCSMRDLGFDSYQALLGRDGDQPTIEHIENVDMVDNKYSEAGPNDGSNKETKTCKQ